jgi:hypothetical protein
MRHHRTRGGDVPPLTDPAFVEALAGSGSKRSPRNRHRDHKAQMLCRQVQRALNLALGELRDDVLRELYICSTPRRWAETSAAACWQSQSTRRRID